MKSLATARLKVAIKDFLRDGRGVVSTETILVLPILIWAYLAMFVFWEAFRAVNTNAKASHTIADMISRESTVTVADITGMGMIHRYLSNTPEDTSIRVTSVQYRAQGNSYRVLWSRHSNKYGEPLTNAKLKDIEDRLPVMSDGDSVVILESWRDYRPAFAMGLEPMTISHFVLTRPRFDTAVCLNTPNCFNL
ncbi:MAG: TadE/TadG family type IV pilus assembly protein [Gemmobacter sp.]